MPRYVFLKCSNGLSLYIRLTTTTTFIDPLYLKKLHLHEMKIKAKTNNNFV